MKIHPKSQIFFKAKKKFNFPPKKYSYLPTYLKNKKRLSKVILIHCFEPFSWYGNHCWDTCCLKLALQSKIFQIGLLSFLAYKKSVLNNGQMLKRVLFYWLLASCCESKCNADTFRSRFLSDKEPTILMSSLLFLTYVSIQKSFF